MSERWIEVGDKHWKPAREVVRVRWRTSQKGNPYCTFRGFAIVVCRFREGGHYRYMVKPEQAGDDMKWEVYGKFVTEEEAKESAVAALMVGKKELPSSDVTVSNEEEAMTFVKRKIVL